jgi:hypothetical protein
MDEYLPPSTFQWCREQLQQLGFDPSQPANDASAPHRTIYLQLRTIIDQHLTNGNVPELGLSIKPTGAFDWQGPIATDNVQEAQLAGEDPDEETMEE